MKQCEDFCKRKDIKDDYPLKMCYICLYYDEKDECKLYGRDYRTDLNHELGRAYKKKSIRIFS